MRSQMVRSLIIESCEQSELRFACMYSNYSSLIFEVGQRCCGTNSAEKAFEENGDAGIPTHSGTASACERRSVRYLIHMHLYKPVCITLLHL